MQFFILAFGLLSLVPFTLAQSLAGLPACAQSCALNAIAGSGCPATNTTCICESATFISSYSACVATSCNATDQATATQFGVQYCAAAGVTLSVPASTAPSTSVAASTAGPAATTAAASTSAPSATAATTASGGQSESPTSATSSLSTFSGAAQPRALGNDYGWMLAGLGLAGGFMVAEL